MSGHHHHHHTPPYQLPNSPTPLPRLHRSNRDTTVTPPGSGMSSRTGTNPKSSMSTQSVSYGNHNFHHFGLQPIPFVIPHGLNMGYVYYQTGIDQQNCHTPTSAQPAQLMAGPQQTHFSSTATPHLAQLHAQFPVQLPMLPPAVQQAQFASPQGGSFYVPGNYAYMPNAFQSQATMLPQAFQTMTPQDPFVLITNYAYVPKVVSGETVPSKTTTNNTTLKKKKRNRKRRKLKTVAGEILSTCENIQGKVNAIEGSSATEVTEAISGDMVLGKTSLPGVKMVSKEEEHTEVANGKMGSSATTNINVKGAVNSSITVGQILTPQNLQKLKADNGETGSGTTAADTTASKKRKRGKKKKNSPLSGDILSTCENIQDKVNAIDCLSTTKVLDTKVTNKTELSDITNHNVDGKKGPEVVNSKIDASNRTSKQKTKKQKVDVTQGKKLVIFEVDGMLADIVFPIPKDVEPDKYSHGEAVFKRPYLDDFLSFCFEKFHVGIWSSRMRKNLDPVVHYLFGDLTKKLLFTWDDFHCRKMTLENRYKCIIFKDLRRIWEKNGRSWVKGTFNESNTLLLDDSPYKALLNPKHTGIFPTSYKYTDMNDDCLGSTGALQAYLEGFAAADDGRTYVEQNPFGQGPVDEMNPDWKYYSRVLKSEMVLGEDPSEIIEITQATLGKKLIIFDVNGMLADIVLARPKDVEADKFSHGKAVFKKPYLDDFLSFCFEKFYVCIWSSTMKKNLDPVVDCLFGDLKKKLLFIWDASHCRNPGMRTLEDRYKCNVCKELGKIWEKNCLSWVNITFNGSKTLLLDDSPYKALLNPKHMGFFSTSYKYTDTNDDCLGFNMEIWRKFVNELHELLVNSDRDQLSMGTDIVCMECGKDMVPELREKGICMNKENFGTYEAMDSYAREYDIAGAKGMECGWIYE